MWLSLLGTAFVMGLVGGPHCLAMCAAPCAAIVSSERVGTAVVQLHRENAGAQRNRAADGSRWLGFHGGRLMGYAALGAAAAYAMDTVAWFSDRTSALHPVWVLLHLAALAWGLVLLFQARQPQWVELGGRKLWGRVQHRFRGAGSAWLAGGLWVFLPCGLLYSAVMVAALAGGVWQGAASMVAFGVGSGLWLAVGPWLWQRAKRLKQWRESWGLRTAGALLVAVSLWALWSDVVHMPSQWCR